ncbi:MAG TPA: tRNA uridine-5-carboxymethylaminomethyl(34) synthesis GTPase MnmE, partial [Verrucomicrobiae bacterium]|nr:tRNA uridine-5-carboxymethylaminomethyl(34) synthesis GTPase MnmE [Verrucomicrobiae bacterium]
SGSKSFNVADAAFRGKTLSSVAPTHTVHYGHIVRDGEVVDEVLLTVLRAPRTFTGEDTVEVSCHGGVLAAKLVLDTLLANGARLAQPGEFTRRAFLNGRIDLTQAEAVIDLIHSRTELALRAANQQLAGHLGARINTLRDSLMIVLAHVEAHIDFPDEDIAPDTREKLLSRLGDAFTFINDLLKTAPEGQILRRGVRAAIVGKPNVGKSSLLNCLLGHDRAIVSPIPGTTRDTIEETANIRGIPVVFIDTAGLRESADTIEQEGIRRSRETLEKAELILHVLDQSAPNDSTSIQSTNPLITILNKTDLPHAFELPDAIEISCATGAGLEQLKDRIKDAIWSGRASADSSDVMINSRHEDALQRAKQGISNTTAALEEGHSIELAAMDLRLAVNAIGEIVGKTTTEDLLDAIFSQFCIGK